MAIKAVIFDFCQTLVDSADGFRSAEKTAQKRIFANLALTDWDAFLRIYRGVRGEFHASSCFSRTAAWQEVYWRYCREGEDRRLAQWETEYWDEVEADARPFPETMQVLTALAETYKLALISNTEGRAGSDDHPIKHFPDLRALLDVIVISGEAGVPAKPDPAAFTTCLDRLGLAAAECVYVGDDWGIDICGASEAGIQPIWIQHHSVERTYPDVETSAPIIDSLAALGDLDGLLQCEGRGSQTAE